MNCCDINYFLFLKKKQQHILQNLEDIYCKYQEINDYLNRELYINNIEENCISCQDYIKDKKDYICTLQNYCVKYKKDINDLNMHLKFIHDKIQTICTHNFVEDSIDITPEISQTIVYCKICEYTKP